MPKKGEKEDKPKTRGASKSKGVTKSKKTAKKKKDKDAPKKNMNAYMFFAQANREKVKNDLGEGAKPTQVTKKLGELWKAASEKDKKPFEEQAAKDKERYEKANAEYKKKKEKEESASEEEEDDESDDE